MAIYGAELAESIKKQLEQTRETVCDRQRRIYDCEVEDTDCFVSSRLDDLKINELTKKLEILKGDGLMDFNAVFDEEGKEVAIHCFPNRWGGYSYVGRGIFASSLKALLKKTGWTEKVIKVPVWVKYECSGSGLAGALSGTNRCVRWHTNMVTGEYVGYPD